MPDRNERKEIVKEAFKEWLDEIFLTFGKWSAMALGAVIVAGICYFILWINGWHR